MKSRRRGIGHEQLRHPVAQRRRDVELAHARIGATVDARCHWVLDDFASRDPDTMATAERAVLRDNLLALAQGLPRDWPEGTEPPPGGSTWDLADPPDAELHALWTGIVALTQAHHAPVPLPAVEEGLLLWPPVKPLGRQRARFERFRDWPDFRTALLHRAADLLQACERLRECPECHRLFVARRRQERHPACARKARDSRRPSRRKGA